jgi:hypothetical protein
MLEHWNQNEMGGKRSKGDINRDKEWLNRDDAELNRYNE